MKNILLTVLTGFILLFSSSTLNAQKAVRQQLRAGNKAYNTEKFTEAEIAYRKALEANTNNRQTAYNLGNALYKQGKFQDAVNQYQSVLANTNDKKELARTWHNIGNLSMNAKDYTNSIYAYKMSLINNPTDDETRYNLAVAQKLLKEQEQNNQDQEQQQDKKDKQQEDKDQKEQDPNQDNDPKNKEQDKDNKDKQPENKEQQSNMNRQMAEQILEAMEQDEKKTQQKVQEKEANQAVVRSKSEKDW